MADSKKNRDYAEKFQAEIGIYHGYYLYGEVGNRVYIHLSERRCHDTECQKSHCFCDGCLNSYRDWMCV